MRKKRAGFLRQRRGAETYKQGRGVIENMLSSVGFDRQGEAMQALWFCDKSGRSEGSVARNLG